MLKVTLNRPKPQAKEIITEEHTGFRVERSTTEQIFNLRILCKKYLKHQQILYNVIIDFKKEKKKKKKKKKRKEKKHVTWYGVQPYRSSCEITVLMKSSSQLGTGLG